MENEDLKERIAQLEFQNDQLTTELEYVDQLLRSVGFAEGLKSVKEAAQELAEYEDNQKRMYEDGMPDSPPGVED
jgi:hypothetical protein